MYASVAQSAIQSRNSNRNDDDDRPRLSAEGSQALDPEETEGRDTQRELMEEFAASVVSLLLIHTRIYNSR